MLSWLKKRRRAKLLEAPFPGEWLQVLKRNVALYHGLSEEQRAKLHDQLRIFMAERDWEGCGGQSVGGEVKVTISALACLLTLGRGVDEYSMVRTILVYPTAYFSTVEEPDESGVVAVDDDDREGEAWPHGVVVLSWRDARHDAKRLDGRNLVLHEFAHQLDMGDGEANGTPVLDNSDMAERWKAVMTDEFNALKRRAGKHQKGVLDTYGAEDESEFFAVATEAFFERPEALMQEHRALYDLLKGYYRQDPLLYGEAGRSC